MFASHFFPHPTAHIPNANAKWDAGSTLYLRSQYSSEKKKNRWHHGLSQDSWRLRKFNNFPHRIYYPMDNKGCCKIYAKSNLPFL